MKMYIAVLDEVPEHMVPTLVAHSVLAAHMKFIAANHFSNVVDDGIYIQRLSGNTNDVGMQFIPILTKSVYGEHFAAESNCEIVFNILNNSKGFTAGGQKILNSISISDTQYEGITKNGKPIYSCVVGCYFNREES